MSHDSKKRSLGKTFLYSFIRYVIPVPSLESLYKYGFDFNVEIEPKVLEKNRIYHSIDLAKNSRLKPQVDFPRLMEYIQERENKIVTSVAAK